jgi:hypothetical protein
VYENPRNPQLGVTLMRNNGRESQAVSNQPNRASGFGPFILGRLNFGSGSRASSGTGSTSAAVRSVTVI